MEIRPTPLVQFSHFTLHLPSLNASHMPAGNMATFLGSLTSMASFPWQSLSLNHWPFCTSNIYINRIWKCWWKLSREKQIEIYVDHYWHCWILRAETGPDQVFFNPWRGRKAHTRFRKMFLCFILCITCSFLLFPGVNGKPSKTMSNIFYESTRDSHTYMTLMPRDHDLWGFCLRLADSSVVQEWHTCTRNCTFIHLFPG